jgi:hypothetical protein
MPEIIKEGYLSLKEEGLRAWIWSKRYCVLRDQSLTFHRNEVKKKRRVQNKVLYSRKLIYITSGRAMYWSFVSQRYWISY